MCAPLIPGATDDGHSWLSDGHNANTREWVRAQNENTFAKLKSLDIYSSFRNRAVQVLQAGDRVEEAVSGGSPFRTQVHRGFVYQRWQDSSHPRGLWRRSTLTNFLQNKPKWEPELDLDSLARTEGEPIRFVSASFFGDRALLTFEGAEGDYSFREFDTARKKFIKSGFNLERVRGQTAEWVGRDALVLGNYTAKKAFVWRRGEPISAASEIYRCDCEHDQGAFDVRTLEIQGRRVVTLEVGSEESPDLLLWRDPWKMARPILRIGSDLTARRVLLGFKKDQLLIELLDGNWTIANETLHAGSVLAIAYSDLTAENPVVYKVEEEPRNTFVESITLTEEGLYSISYEDLKPRLFRYVQKSGHWLKDSIDVPKAGALKVEFYDSQTGAMFLIQEDFLQPPRRYLVSPGSLRARLISSTPPAFDSAGFITQQNWAVAEDGVRVPYFVVRPRTIGSDGDNPAIIHAYGRQVPELPTYDGILGSTWLACGGVYVVANVRGGADLGRRWIVRGIDRARTYGDLIAVAQDLIDRGITSAKKIGLRGFSNGGLLMATAINMRPNLFGAAALENPILDYFYDPTFAGDSLYGSYSDVRIRAFLEATSPYQNLRFDSSFPTPLIVTSADDSGLTDGGAARKYAARIAELGMREMFFERSNGGHSYGSTTGEVADYEALVYTYFAHELHLCNSG